MANFKVGQAVIRNNDNTHGVVVEVLPERRGRQLYKVSFPTGIVDALETSLSQIYDVSDPYERCVNGIFGSYSDYSRINTTFKIRNSSNNTISSLKASKTLFRAYQFKPLLKFLNSPNRRLLVADEVGLGKTIEAGHIMMELKARRELHNILIICPMSLQDKWRAELFEKFGLSFKIYKTSNDLISDLEQNVRDIHAIINYEKIRAQKDDGDFNRALRTSKCLADYFSSCQKKFSLVVCDEAHKMRNKETLTYRGAELIVSQADAAVFLTATPIMISTENLFNLLHLLDPSRYFSYQIFENRLKENHPFIDAITSLNANRSLSSIAESLNNSIIDTRFTADEKEIYSSKVTVAESFSEDPLFQEVKRLLAGEDTPKIRARLQYLLSSLSVMNTVFSRTRKREVTTDMSQAERKPHRCDIVLTAPEQKEFDRIIEEYYEDNATTNDWGEEGLTPGASLGLVQKKRQIASSVYAFLNRDSDLDAGIDAYGDCDDSKVSELQHIITNVFSSGIHKLVIFAIFRKTLKYLSIRLSRLGYKCVIIHGQVANRTQILSEFRNNPEVQILLSSEVGSEGLDFQFCNSMVNFDLPWNPMVVEQRIGRIDRFGQKSKIVNIYNLVVSGSIQEQIYVRLLERIGIFKGAIGDMEAILDAPFSSNNSMTIQDAYQKMEKEFFTQKLSNSEIERKITEIQRAIENEKVNLEHLQDGLNNSLTNDSYFREEINRILYNNAYVTKEELKNYLESVMRQKLTTCSITSLGGEIYEFHISKSDSSALINFLNCHFPYGNDSDLGLEDFRLKIRDEETFKFTFSQSTAYDYPDIQYLNIYHPLIQACLNYFVSNEDVSKTTFCYALDNDDVLRVGDQYYLAIYQLSSMRKVQGIMKSSVDIFPVVYCCGTQHIINDDAIVNRIYQKTQTQGKERNIKNGEINVDVISNMRYDFAEQIQLEKSRRIEEISIQMESDRRRNEIQTKEYCNSRVANYKARISDFELELLSASNESLINRLKNQIRFLNDRIEDQLKERDGRLAMINDVIQPEIMDNMISLNLITII